MSRRGSRLYHATGNRDRNEQPIVETLRTRGFHVTHLQGRGVPDLLVSYDLASSPQMWLVEVKQPKAGYTEAQKKFREQWRGPAIVTLRSMDEALIFPIEDGRS